MWPVSRQVVWTGLERAKGVLQGAWARLFLAGPTLPSAVLGPWASAAGLGHPCWATFLLLLGPCQAWQRGCSGCTACRHGWEARRSASCPGLGVGMGAEAGDEFVPMTP